MSYLNFNLRSGVVTWLVIWCLSMSPEAGRAWFRIAMMITLTSAVLAFLTQPGSAERVVSVVTMVMGLLFIGVIVFLIRRDHF